MTPEGRFVTQTTPFAQTFKLAAGMTQERAVPEFAPLTLQQRFGRRGGPTNPSGRKVVLSPDTFNNHLHTDVGVAAVEALEAAGWQVIVPEGHICCGRPLYDYGFLDLAERYLRRSLDQLREWYREGIPIVGLEPSCVAVFKDELGKLLPHDDDATRLAQSTVVAAGAARAAVLAGAAALALGFVSATMRRREAP